jgi:hypothetical protein
MPEMADILRAAAPEYLAKYGPRMLPSHKRAINDITRCRTPALGGRVFRCQPCDEYRYSYHSCRNRTCTKCGNDAATRWLATQQARLLPVTYFMVTPTLPKQLRPLARRHQKLIYGLLFRTAAAAIQKLARDPKFVGGVIGIVGVLQTWTRDMRYHPHIHFIVPGGALSQDHQRWLPVQRDYLMPERALAKILRAKFRDALKKTELFEQVPQEVWKTDWVVNIKSVGTGEKALKYLAPYIFRVAISNQRITRFRDGKVTFTYKDSKGRWHASTLDAEKFISRFLQHVLPKSFVKVRYYGFLGSRNHDLFGIIKELFNLFNPSTQKGGTSPAAQIRVMSCPKCGQPMVLVAEIKPVRNRSP